MKIVSLYWFAAQQQTIIVTRQRFGLFYPKFSVEFNELSLTGQKVRGKSQKTPKTKIVLKNAHMRVLEAKG